MNTTSLDPEHACPIAEVVILKQLDRVFHYSVPEAFRARLEPGMRVLVPFRNEWLTGIVTRRLRKTDVTPLKPILEILGPAPLLDRPMMALARWLADYYVTGWGVAMKTILPPGLEVKIGRHYRLTETGREAISGSSRPRVPGRTILTKLEHSMRGLRLAALLKQMDPQGTKNQPPGRNMDRQLSILVRKGWVEETKIIPRKRRYPSTHPSTPRHPFPSVSQAPSPDRESAAPLIPEELQQVVRSKRFGVFCLEGKQERSNAMIVAMIQEMVRMGRSVILLVPEIGRVSGWVSRLKAQGLDSIAMLHSGLTDRERQAEWERIRHGEASIVVGTRLAVFAPLPDAGLIIVEDEQDPAYKQEESPRYHARDVAVLRATHHDALALLTSAAPSLETYHNILSRKYGSIRLAGPGPCLPAGRPGPTVRIIDLAKQSHGTFVSDELLGAVEARLEKKDPVVLILNRRGFGAAFCCRDCGFVARCPRCQIAMVYSKRNHQAGCHYCGKVTAPPTVCGQCQGTRLALMGAGTEKAEEFLKARFPLARIARLDRDTARPEDVAAAIEQIDRSQLDLVIGTQLLLKSSALTRPGLVGLLQADGAFHHPDFRAGEQTFQLIGRVLAFANGGEVILQTHHPTHESIAWTASGDPKEFYEKELAQRKALGYPPFMRLAVVTVKALKESKAAAAAQRLSERFKSSVKQAGLQILGPAAAIRPKLHGKYRWQILIKAPSSGILHRALQSGLRSARSEPGRSQVWFEVDVDPQRIV